MVKYWDWQHAIDIACAIAIAGATVWLPQYGGLTLMTINAEALVQSARSWVGPALTLLGMMSATTAFIFSVVDRNEFKALRDLGVERQLWAIFSQNILRLSLAAVTAMLVAITNPVMITSFLLFGLTFVFVMVVICLFKFAWVMRQIISVRASR